MDITREYDDNEKVYIEYWKNSKGTLIAIKYLDEFKRLHRLNNKPAFYYFYENGMILQHAYFTDGRRNRVDGPASISYYPNGDIWKEEYWEDDELKYSNVY